MAQTAPSPADQVIMAGLGELLARADGLGATGGGHVMRQLALAQAWCDAGGSAALATAGAPPAVLDRWSSEGCAVMDPTTAAGRRPAWVVADGYELGPEDVEPWRGAAPVAQVDDHARSRAVAASVIIDHNLGAQADAYDDRRPAEVLTGPRYCLLRREHRRPPARQVEKRVQRVLVTLGASPEPADLDRLQSLVNRALPRAEVVLFPPGAGVDDVAGVLASVDLAISAAGTTTWELLAWGVPSILVSLAANQDPVLDAVASAGIALRLPLSDGEALLSVTAADGDLRQEMASHGQRLIDGDGARRVVAALRAGTATSRAVGPGDREMLWRWANDPSTRSSAVRKAPITWAEHVAWFEAGQRSADRLHWIIEQGGRAVGQTRFDGILREPCAEISVSVDSEQRNLGYGPVVILAGIAALRQGLPDRPIVALIRPDNVASLRSFDLAGFVVDGRERRRGVDLVRLKDAQGAPVASPT